MKEIRFLLDRPFLHPEQTQGGGEEEAPIKKKKKKLIPLKKVLKGKYSPMLVRPFPLSLWWENDWSMIDKATEWFKEFRPMLLQSLGMVGVLLLFNGFLIIFLALFGWI